MKFRALFFVIYNLIVFQKLCVSFVAVIFDLQSFEITTYCWNEYLYVPLVVIWFQVMKITEQSHE